jgi:hypothetical protein
MPNKEKISLIDREKVSEIIKMCEKILIFYFFY